MQQTKTMKNGIRIVTKSVPDLYSVSMGIYVGTGSANENEKNNGISHLIEHMMFKGTKKRSAFQIADEMDSIGAKMNAFTTKEMTCYYAKSTADHAEECFEILSDLFCHSVFPEEELEREKKVILEEISMTEDSPEDLASDILSEQFFRGISLARPIIGTPENVLAATRQDLLDYIAEYYANSHIVIAFAGKITMQEAEKLVKEHFEWDNPAERCDVCYGTDYTSGGIITRAKDVEQASICIGYDFAPFADKDSYKYLLLNTVLGGGMSSRLFQEIREKLGYAYSVYSYATQYRNAGLFTIYVGTNPDNTKKCLETVDRLLEEFQEKGITQKEFERGREQLKSSVVFGQENNTGLMNVFGKYLLFTGEIFDFDGKLKEFESYTLEEMNRLAKTMFDRGRKTISMVAKEKFLL